MKKYVRFFSLFIALTFMFSTINVNAEEMNNNATNEEQIENLERLQEEVPPITGIYTNNSNSSLLMALVLVLMLSINLKRRFN